MYACIHAACMHALISADLYTCVYGRGYSYVNSVHVKVFLFLDVRMCTIGCVFVHFFCIIVVDESTNCLSYNPSCE